MSDKTPVENLNKSEASTPSLQRKWKALAVIILAAIVIAAGAFWWQNKSVSSARPHPAQAQFAELQQQVAQLTQQQQALAAGQQQLQQHISALPHSNSQITKIQISALLHRAQMAANVEHNLALSQALLTLALQQSKSLTSTGTSLQVAIQQDLTSIASMLPFQPKDLVEQFSKLQQQIDHLTLFVPGHFKALPRSEKASTETGWRKWWHQSLDALKKIVIVRRVDSSVPPLLTRQQFALEKQYLRVLYQQALSAGLARQAQMYAILLTQAKQALQQYLLSSHQRAEQLLEQTNALMKVNVAPNPPVDFVSLKPPTPKVEKVGDKA